MAELYYSGQISVTTESDSGPIFLLFYISNNFIIC